MMKTPTLPLPVFKTSTWMTLLTLGVFSYASLLTAAPAPTPPPSTPKKSAKKQPAGLDEDEMDEPDGSGDGDDETEKEWAIISHAQDLNYILETFKTVEALGQVNYSSKEEQMEKQRLLKIFAQKKESISKKDLLRLKKVRSIQVNQLGLFKYPYFTCRFKAMDDGVFFEKTKGSQRKSGKLFEDDDNQMVFLGGWSVNEDPQHVYSGLRSTGFDKKEHDEAGIFVKRGGKVFAIFSKGIDKGFPSFEVYEFSK